MKATWLRMDCTGEAQRIPVEIVTEPIDGYVRVRVHLSGRDCLRRVSIHNLRVWTELDLEGAMTGVGEGDTIVTTVT